MDKSGMQKLGLMVAVCVLALTGLCGFAGAQSRGVLREVFGDIPGTMVSDMTNHASFPRMPSAVTLESSFEAPSEFGDNYGNRMRAWPLMA